MEINIKFKKLISNRNEILVGVFFTIILYLSTTPFEVFPFELSAPILLTSSFILGTLTVLTTILIFSRVKIYLPSYREGIFSYIIIVMISVSFFKTGLNIWLLYFFLLFVISLFIFNLKQHNLFSLNTLVVPLSIVILFEVIKELFHIKGLYIPLLNNFSNNNIKAIYLVFALPFFLTYFKNQKRIQFLMFFLMTFICLYLQCRTALIGILILIVIILNEQKNKLNTLNSYKLKKTLFTGIFILSIFIILLSIRKSESNVGRLLIFGQTLSLITDNPFTGSGFGSFQKQITLKLEEYFSSDRPEQIQDNFKSQINIAYNDCIQLIVENGLLGFCLFLSIGMIIYQTRKKGLLYNVIPILYLFMSLVNSLIYAVPCGIILSMWIGYNYEIKSHSIPTFFAFFPILLIFSFYIYYSFALYTVTIEGNDNLTIPKLSLKKLKNKRYILNSNSYYWKVVGKKFFLENKLSFAETALIKSIEIDRNLNSMLLLSKVYKEMKEYRAQYRILMSINRIVPGSITPKYDLFKYYLNRKDSLSATNYALQILNFSNKFNSLKIANIKLEANQFIIKRTN